MIFWVVWVCLKFWNGIKLVESEYFVPLGLHNPHPYHSKANKIHSIKVKLSSYEVKFWSNSGQNFEIISKELISVTDLLLRVSSQQTSLTNVFNDTLKVAHEITQEEFIRKHQMVEKDLECNYKEIPDQQGTCLLLRNRRHQDNIKWPHLTSRGNEKHEKMLQRVQIFWWKILWSFERKKIYRISKWTFITK